MALEFKILDETPVYRGFFNLTRYHLRHSTYEGGWSDPLMRELFHRGRCVAVLPYDPLKDEILLIEQFRIGAVGSKAIPWLLETVAGAIESGESPEEVAHREGLEEAGCQFQSLIRVGTFYTSPGGTSEEVTVFIGVVKGPLQEGIFGLEEEGEDIRALVMSLNEALVLLEAGVIDSVVPALALQWLALHRDRLDWDAGEHTVTVAYATEGSR